jgi:KOW motif-containing protein
MQAWAVAAAGRLAKLGFDVGAGGDAALPGLDQDPLSAPAGASFIRVVLARSERGGEDTRATIALVVGEEHVEVAVELPPAGASAAHSRIADPVRALELTTALEALPEQFAIGLAGEHGPAPASRASTDQIRALLERAEREQRALWLGWSVPREVAVAHAVLLDEQLEDAVVALGSVFAILAPPQGRQVSGPAGTWSTPSGAEAPRGHLASRRRDQRDGSRSDDERPGAKRRARARDQKRERDGELPVEPADSREHDGGAAPRPQRAASAKAPVRAGVRRNVGSASGTIDKGSRVRVLEGPFSGKVGVVQELDGKGGARVMLGLLAVRVDVSDLARSADRGGRPVLSTSHRKPIPVRS